MTNSPNQKMLSESDVQVAEAWTKHYKGQNSEAVTLFQRIVETWPDHIDAFYGYGLALKTAEQKQQAAAAFQKAKDLIEAELKKPLDDNTRFVMLARIVDQQLATLN